MIALENFTRQIPALRPEVAQKFVAARQAQKTWARRPVRERASLIGSLRSTIARHAPALAEVTAELCRRTPAEKLVSEVVPLADGCRFLEKNAARILRPRRHGVRGRPLWLLGARLAIERKPWGVVLIVGPGNYPLFLPAIQALQALVAGNAVLLKPAEQSSAPLRFFREEIFRAAGLDPNLMLLLPESPEAAREAANCGVDKVVFTGSSANGRDFLAHLAPRNIPAIMELSGQDPVYVRGDADLDLVVRTIAFARDLNGGETCMLPHIIYVDATLVRELHARFAARGLSTSEIVAVANDQDALLLMGDAEAGLGATIFSRDENTAAKLAADLATGFVTINDIIVPTADPRFPFGGVRSSGFGVTRGREGLLEMTYPHSVSVRRAKIRPHLMKSHPADADLFAGYLGLAHGRGFKQRISGLCRLFSAAMARRKKR